LVSPNNWNSSHCNDNCKYDCHKYDADLPVSKLDPFTTGAYVYKCIKEKLFRCCKLFQNNQDINLFIALVFDEIGMDGYRPEDKYKQMTCWGNIRKMIKTGQMISGSCVLINGTLQQRVSHLLSS